MLVLHAVILKELSRQQMWPGRAAEAASCQQNMLATALKRPACPSA